MNNQETRRGNMTAQKEYERLFKQGQYIHTLDGVFSLLGWDQETFMPDGAADYRGKQLEAMAGIIHKERVGKKLVGPLSKLIDLKSGEVIANDLSQRQKKALKEWRRDYMIDKALPKKFVENFAKLTSEAILVWREARANKQFKQFEKKLQKVVDITKKKADYLGYKDHPYDALLDLYEPNMSVKTLSPIFDTLKTEVVSLLKKIVNAEQVDDRKILGHYPKEKQVAISNQILQQIGFDFKYGRLDFSTHPFSSGHHPTDSRITTRINENNIFDCLATVLHEAGHSLYSMGLPVEEFGSPLGDAISMGIHESQSRFWETRIGMSQPFVKFLLPLLQKEFPQLQNVSIDECYRSINKVQPSFIRVEADEVTYPLHVILRYEIEKGLLEGRYAIKELPQIWNEKMKDLLGITPRNDAEGCLQDIHWSMGGIGYFPTYTLGNLYAAQLFIQFEKEHPNWKELLSHGKFDFIKQFLHKHVYRYGREFRPQELIEKATQKPFSAKDYTDYLKQKYQNIYNFK